MAVVCQFRLSEEVQSLKLAPMEANAGERPPLEHAPYAVACASCYVGVAVRVGSSGAERPGSEAQAASLGSTDRPTVLVGPHRADLTGWGRQT